MLNNKTIGMLGGMSWESTLTYYKIINTVVKEQLGGFHSAKCILYSVDFQEIEDCQTRGDWSRSAEILGAAAQSLEKAGADFLLLCTNTMHKVAGEIQERVDIPLLHIAEVTAQALLDRGISHAALLGTKYTMEQNFYKAALANHGIAVLTPEIEQRQKINDIIFHELCLGKTNAESKLYFLSVIEEMTAKGAESVILGCTEIGLLVRQEDTKVPLLDTTILHATKAALLALEDEKCCGRNISASVL